MTEEVQIRRKDDVSWVTINRPEKKNALKKEMLHELKQFFLEEASSSTPSKVIILQGSGGTFCSGYDLNDLWEDIGSGGDNYISEANTFESCFQAIRDYPFPVIAGIEGKAIGGGSILACSSDIRIGVKGMSFGFTPAKLGLVYPPKGMWRLVSIVGLTFAREMSLTAMFYDDKKALECGFINRLVEKDELEVVFDEYVQAITKLSPLALKSIKRSLNIMEDPSSPQDELYRILQASVKGKDCQEGIRAFLEKRNPNFIN